LSWLDPYTLLAKSAIVCRDILRPFAANAHVMRRSIALVALAGLIFLAPRQAHAQDNPFANCEATEAPPVSTRGNSVDPIEGGRRTRLFGPVVITCKDWMLLADSLDYDTTTEEVVVTGSVSLLQPDVTVYAERAVLNRKTRLGTFYEASGWARVGDEPTTRSSFGTMEPDVHFWGAEIAKIGPTRYQIKKGGFTSCVQATPRWEMTTSDSTITLDKYALLKNVVLHVKNVPLLYVPVLYYPINKEDRATGFLMPQYGSSTYLGKTFSNAFFWAIARNQDLTMYHNWQSKSGQSVSSEYRYVSPSNGNGKVLFDLQMTKAVRDSEGEVTKAAKRSASIDGDGRHALPHGFSAGGVVHYFTDIQTKQLHQDIDDFSGRERNFAANVAGRIRSLRIDAKADQRETFYGQNPGQRWGTLPSAIATLSDRAIGRSKIYVGGYADGTYVVRQNNLEDPTTNTSLFRFDAAPVVRAPLSTLPYLNATGSASWRLTRWWESLDPKTHEQVPVPMTRQVLDLNATVTGPILSRVFLTPNNTYADGFKHLIEPGISIQRTMSPFTGYENTVYHDGKDTAVPNVTNVTYRLTNRILARRPRPSLLPGGPPLPGVAREILSVDISQTYYSTKLAAVVDPLNQLDDVQTAADKATNLQPVQFRARSQPVDSTSVDFSMRIDPTTKQIMNLRTSGTINAELIQANAGWSKIYSQPDDLGKRTVRSHSLDATTTLRTRSNRVSGSYGFNLDVATKSFIQQRVMASYNSQCCGISFDWQSFRTPFLPTPHERRFQVSFSLAGIGSFSNPMGSFGGQ
jgi:hypothetical protein